MLVLQNNSMDITSLISSIDMLVLQNNSMDITSFTSNSIDL